MYSTCSTLELEEPSFPHSRHRHSTNYVLGNGLGALDKSTVALASHSASGLWTAPFERYPKLANLLIICTYADSIGPEKPYTLVLTGLIESALALNLLSVTWLITPPRSIFRSSVLRPNNFWIGTNIKVLT